MKISEMIEQLENIRKLHGDLTVKREDVYEGGEMPVLSVDLSVSSGPTFGFLTPAGEKFVVID